MLKTSATLWSKKSILYNIQRKKPLFSSLDAYEVSKCFIKKNYFDWRKIWCSRIFFKHLTAPNTEKICSKSIVIFFSKLIPRNNKNLLVRKKVDMKTPILRIAVYTLVICLFHFICWLFFMNFPQELIILMNYHAWEVIYNDTTRFIEAIRGAESNPDISFSST